MNVFCVLLGAVLIGVSFPLDGWAGITCALAGIALSWVPYVRYRQARRRP